MSSGRAKTVSFISASGGVGKTTLSLALTDYIYSNVRDPKQKRILLVDLDPTAGLSLSVLSEEEYDTLVEQGKTLCRLIESIERKVPAGMKITDYIHRLSPPQLKGVVFDLLLPGEELSDRMTRLWESGSPGSRFKSYLERAGVYSEYNYVIFDSAPFFDRRYTVANLYASDKYIVVLRPGLVDLKRTLRMLEWLEQESEQIAGSTEAFYRRFMSVFNMIRKGVDESDLILHFLGKKVERRLEEKEHLRSMFIYIDELDRRIGVAKHYVGEWADIQRLNFLRIKSDKEKAPEFEGLREEIFSWLNA